MWMCKNRVIEFRSEAFGLSNRKDSIPSVEIGKYLNGSGLGEKIKEFGVVLVRFKIIY